MIYIYIYIYGSDRRYLSKNAQIPVILVNFRLFVYIRSEKNGSNHTKKNLCAPIVQNMASVQVFKCSGGEIRRWRNRDFPKITYLLTLCTFWHFWDFWFFLQMFCEQIKISGNPLIWARGGNGGNQEILRKYFGCFLELSVIHDYRMGENNRQPY